MKQQMCSRCGERPAVVFIQKMENDKVTPEGLCIKCARELNIGSINQMIDKLGISDEEIEAASEQMANLISSDLTLFPYTTLFRDRKSVV